MSGINDKIAEGTAGGAAVGAAIGMYTGGPAGSLVGAAAGGVYGGAAGAVNHVYEKNKEGAKKTVKRATTIGKNHFLRKPFG